MCNVRVLYYLAYENVVKHPSSLCELTNKGCLRVVVVNLKLGYPCYMIRVGIRIIETQIFHCFFGHCVSY